MVNESRKFGLKQKCQFEQKEREKERERERVKVKTVLPFELIKNTITVCLSVSLFVCWIVSMFVGFLSVRKIIGLLTVYLSLPLWVYLSIFLSLCLSVCLFDKILPCNTEDRIIS